MVESIVLTLHSRYANNESYDRAIEDFEAALKINSEHKNARKYLCEVMLAKGAEYV